MKGVFLWVLAAVAGLSAFGAALLYGPWTGAPAATSVTVSWAMAPAISAEVRYAPLSHFQATCELPFVVAYQPQTPSSKEIAHLKIENLEPDTWYVYKLILSDGEASPVGTFRTAPEPGELVTFGVISDTQWQWTEPNRIEMVAEAMAQDPWAFHFVLHGGDLVETPIPTHWEFFFQSMAPILRWAPLLPVLGNHERDSLSYYQHFELPPGSGRLGKRWWALHWGDVVVVGLDSNAKTPQDLVEQLSWAKEHLSGPEPHKIVIFHHPIFSSDASYGPGSEGLQALWHPVFVQLGVDLVFNGHAHNYERIERDGITYLVVGGGGANLYRLADARVPGSVVGVENHHFYVAVRADSRGISVRVMGVAKVQGGKVIPERQVLDEFFLPRN